MKNNLIVLLLSVSFLSFGQMTDKKTKKISASMVGSWTAYSASYVDSNNKRKVTDYPIDSYSFQEDRTFSLTSKTNGTSEDQIIEGNWEVNDKGKTIRLYNMTSDKPIESDEKGWFFVINVNNKKLSIYYRFKGNNKADLSRDQEVTLVNFKRA